MPAERPELILADPHAPTRFPTLRRRNRDVIDKFCIHAAKMRSRFPLFIIVRKLSGRQGELNEQSGRWIWWSLYGQVADESYVIQTEIEEWRDFQCLTR